MHRLLLRVLPVVLLAVGIVAPPAFGQGSPEPGVTVDPSSPASKEYALPVPQARKSTDSKKKESSSGQLFGEGVHSTSTKSTPPTTTTNSTPTTTTNSTPTTTTPSTTSSQSTAAAQAEARAKARAKARARAEARAKARAKRRAEKRRE